VSPSILAPISTTRACVAAIAVPLPTRGRGRPRKELKDHTQNIQKSNSGRFAMKVRRAAHNNSARRSRNKFNTAIDELWSLVPEDERIGYDGKRTLARAEKFGIIISYIRRLKEV